MVWLLTRGRSLYLVSFAVVTAWLALHAARVGVENDNESLNDRDPTQLAAYQSFKETFGNDEDLLLAVHHPQLVSPAGLTLIDDLTRRISALDGVRQVFSLTNAKQLVHSDAGADEALLVPRPWDQSEDIAAVAAALDRSPDFTGWLISADRRTGGLVIEIEERADDGEYRAALIRALRAIAAEPRAPGVSLHLTGLAVQKYDVTTYIGRDQAVLMPLAIAMLAVMLAIFFRRPLGVALPLAVTGASVAWTIGLYELCGFRLNAITALLPPVIMVLSNSASVHLFQGWLRSQESDPRRRVEGVLKELFFPCFFCSLTTALGFASLMMADLPAVREFGLFAAVGVLAAFVIAITLIPVVLTFAALPASKLAVANQHRAMRRLLEAAANVAVHRPVVVLAAFVLITLVSALGLPRLHNNTDLVRFLKRDAPLYRDTMFIDRHLTGVNAIEIIAARRDGEPMTSLADVEHIEDLERFAARQPQVASVLSIAAVLRQLARAERGDDRLALPDNDRDVGYLFELLAGAQDRSLIRKLISEDGARVRISIRLHAVGTAVASSLAERLLERARQVFGSRYELTLTGAFYRMARDSNRLVADQIGSFGTGVFTVFLAVALLFRSLKPTIVSLVPNIMPVIWTGGLMGFLGIDLSSGTAMIGSAVIGLVVDDTIHYLNHFYRAYRGDAAAAVRSTTIAVGNPLVMNNLVLVLGFWVGCFGSFKPTIYFSLLTGFTMITAMICDLFVTPACLVLFERATTPAMLRSDELERSNG